MKNDLFDCENELEPSVEAAFVREMRDYDLRNLLLLMEEYDMKEDIKHCGCGRSHTGNDWLLLDYVGIQEVDDGCDLELRNCQCGSTLSVRKTNR